MNPLTHKHRVTSILRYQHESLRVVLLSLAIVTIGSFPAYAQMTGAYAYSDSAGHIGGVYGLGVTEDQYNSYNHTYQVNTTLNSPNGRTSYSSTGFVSPPAQSTVWLSIDESDLGEYWTSSNHSQFCPSGGETYLGSTSSSPVTISILIANYYKYDEHWEGSALWGDYQKCFAPGEPPYCVTAHVPCSDFGGLCPGYANIKNLVINFGVVRLCYAIIVSTMSGC